jgi:hypothetical protein
MVCTAQTEQQSNSLFQKSVIILGEQKFNKASSILFDVHIQRNVIALIGEQIKLSIF